MGGGGGMRAKRPSGPSGEQVKGLRSSILEDETVSDITKNEIRGLIGDSDKISSAKFKEAEDLLEKAREGKDPKFKGRQFQKNLATTLGDRPGSSQTILTR